MGSAAHTVLQCGCIATYLLVYATSDGSLHACLHDCDVRPQQVPACSIAFNQHITYSEFIKRFWMMATAVAVTEQLHFGCNVDIGNV